MSVRPLTKKLCWPLVALTILGFALIVYGSNLPVFSDPDFAQRLILGACGPDGAVDVWYSQRDAVNTLRYPLIQAGLSLVISCLAILLLLVCAADRCNKAIWSPRHKWQFFVVGTVVFGLSWFSQMLGLDLDLGRNEFPWCADTVMIPMMGLSVTYLLLFIIALAVGGLMTLGFRQLPVALFAWDPSSQLRSWVTSIPFFVLILLIVLLGIDGAASSSFMGTPAAILCIYLTEATRSALVSTRKDLSLGT